MRVAVYPGTFDPLTNGHLDIIRRASSIFDEVIILVSVNASKNPLFSLEERRSMIDEIIKVFPNVRTDCFHGLLVDYVKSIKGAVIVKGLRALLDFEYEFQMALVNRQLDGHVETVFLMTSMAYAHVSSSLVKEILSYGGDVSEMVPKTIIDYYAKKGVTKSGH